MELTHWEMSLGLCPDTEVTGRDIFPNVSGHLGPPVIPGYQFQGFPSTSMSGDPSVMTEGRDTPAKIKVVGNIGLSMEI